MVSYIKKLAFTVVGAGLFLGAAGVTAGPVFAQQNTPEQPLIAQSTDTDQPPTGTTVPPPPDDATTDTQATEGGEADPNSVPEDEPNCEGSLPIGWILCPVIEIVFIVFDFVAENVLQEGLLEVNVDGEEEPLLREAWDGFRTLANLIFAIAFFAIIYAEASGRVGFLETYSVTRLLPKMALAVIGIQLSFFISAYLIELFNDLGSGITQIVLAPVDGFSQFQISFKFWGEGSFFGFDVPIGNEIVDSLLGVGLLAAVGIAGLLFFKVIIVFGLIGLLLLFFVLILRKVLIIALVVTSPIAFAAWVLPGTSRVFQLWWDSFIRALAMYPLIMLFLASGQLVGRIAVAGDASFFDSMVGMIATFAPLFLIPATFRLAGAAVVAVGSILTGMSEKVKGDPRNPRSLRSWAAGSAGRNWNRMLEDNYKVGGQRYGFSPLPTPVRSKIKRMPFVDAQAPLVADMSEGKQWVDGIGVTGGDDILRAIAVTGGGHWRGREVRTAEGNKSYSGWLQHGKALYRGADGRGEIRIDAATGAAVAARFNSDTQQYEEDGLISDSDFYSSELIDQVKSMQMSRGRLTNAAMYTMTKSKNEHAQAQVWNGMKVSRWSAAEIQDYANSVWYQTKNSELHNKFLDYDYFSDKPGRNEDVAIELMNATPEKAAKSFKKMIQYVDEAVQSYPLSQQGGSFWRAAQKGLASSQQGTFADPGGLDRKRLDGMYNKVNEALATRRTQVVDPGEGDDGELIGTSQATSEAIREMQDFKRMYEDRLRNGTL